MVRTSAQSLSPYFYPRSPCGERRKINGCVSLYSTFLSTLSLRRATFGLNLSECATIISIHALLAESDTAHTHRPRQGKNFYPRSPCGERLTVSHVSEMPSKFLSTLSLRRATWRCRPGLRGCPISIHALLAESDPTAWCSWLSYWNFYPRSPCGERPNNVLPAYAACGISIHALLAESDGPKLRQLFRALISIHALLAESDICG